VLLSAGLFSPAHSGRAFAARCTRIPDAARRRVSTLDRAVDRLRKMLSLMSTGTRRRGRVAAVYGRQRRVWAPPSIRRRNLACIRCTRKLERKCRGSWTSIFRGATWRSCSTSSRSTSFARFFAFFFHQSKTGAIDETKLDAILARHRNTGLSPLERDAIAARTDSDLVLPQPRPGAVRRLLTHDVSIWVVVDLGTPP
jgi:hypothetical protein